MTAGEKVPTLNLPLDVVDTGFDGYAARIEDAAGIDVAMCFTFGDATTIAQTCNNYHALQQRAAALEAALKRYGCHDKYCPHGALRNVSTCSCGFDAALAAGAK